MKSSSQRRRSWTLGRKQTRLRPTRSPGRPPISLEVRHECHVELTGGVAMAGELGGARPPAIAIGGSGSATRASATRRCRPTRSEGRRSSWTASCSSACRKAYDRPASSDGTRIECSTATRSPSWIATGSAFENARGSPRPRRCRRPRRRPAARSSLRRAFEVALAAPPGARQATGHRRRRWRPVPQHGTDCRRRVPRSACAGWGRRRRRSHRPVGRSPGRQRPEIDLLPDEIRGSARPAPAGAGDGGELIRAIRRDEDDIRPAQPSGQEHEQIERRPVRPVEVVDDHDEAGAFGRLHEEIANVREESAARASAGGRRRDPAESSMRTGSTSPETSGWPLRSSRISRTGANGNLALREGQTRTLARR